MAICTMLVVIPFWCNAPEPEEPREEVREEMVVEAQPAPVVAAEPLPGSERLRPVSELEVLPPAAPRAQPSNPTVESTDYASTDGAARPDPRLYGQAAGPAWTPPPSSVNDAPTLPRSEPTTSAALRPSIVDTPREPEPTPEPVEVARATEPTAPPPRREPVSEPPMPRNERPAPTPYSEPTPEPDTASVALYNPDQAPPPSRPRPEMPRTASVVTPSAAPDPQTGLREIAAVLANGEGTFTQPEALDTPSARHEAEGIAQRKHTRYRRALREQERAERRARRQ